MATVEIAIKHSYHARFLQSIFDSDSKTGNLIIRRSHVIGKHIFSVIRAAHLPVFQNHKPDYTVLTCELPKIYTYDEMRYLYLSPDDVTRLNDFIEAEFNQEYHAFIQMMVDLGMHHKQATQMFIREHGLDEKKFEMLVKRDYRLRKKKKDTCRIIIEKFGYQSVKK